MKRVSPLLQTTLLSSVFLFTSSSYAADCAPLSNVQLTFYGWPDNSPPGPDNAFDCGRGKGPDGTPIAGGLGTYDDPISFATATDNTADFPQCRRIYIPKLQKYFRMEDDCEQCQTDFHDGGKVHIDLWTGSNKKGSDAQNGCETSLPGGITTIINDPPEGLDVDQTPLFDADTGACNRKTYPEDTGNSCSGSSSSSNPPGNSPPGSSSTATTLATSIVPSGTSNPGPPGHVDLVTGGGGGGCTWEGHCIGDPCETYDDCDGTDVCGAGGKCVALSST